MPSMKGRTLNWISARVHGVLRVCGVLEEAITEERAQSGLFSHIRWYRVIHRGTFLQKASHFDFCVYFPSMYASRVNTIVV